MGDFLFFGNFDKNAVGLKETMERGSCKKGRNREAGKRGDNWYLDPEQLVDFYILIQ